MKRSRRNVGTCVLSSTNWDTDEVIKSLIAASAAADEAESNPPTSDALASSLPPAPPPPSSSPPLFHEPMVVTFCQDFDQLLGGGFRVGDITEIVGLPGSGKTQLLMQLCLNVQLHSLLGGCGGEALMIDAEGAVSVERLSQMAEAISSHVRKVTRKFTDKNRSEIRAVASTAALLSGVHIARAFNLTDLTSTISALHEFLSLNPKVKLVCIDSIACHLRYGHLAASSNPRPRTGLLLQLAQSLNAIADRFGVAVIATNHMTTRFLNRNKWSKGAKSLIMGGLDNASRIEPALGESWASACTRRIRLSFETNPDSGINAGNRVATVEKEPIRYRDCVKAIGTSEKPRSAYFIISNDGIRGVPRPRQQQQTQQETQQQTTLQQ